MANREQDWKAMIWIGHDFFHRWRQAVEERYGREEAERLALRVWELVAEGTAGSYRKAQVNPDNLEEVVRAMARSSDMMGEKVRVERQGEDWLLIHEECPWMRSFAASGAAGRCQPGCDRWFQATLAGFAPGYEVSTECALPAGGPTCTRRFRRRKN